MLGSKRKVIVVAGPTASGKSALAVDIAKEVDGVIINADSMQVYKGLKIVSACPSPEEQAEVEHRLFEIYDCSIRGNVVDWLERAVTEIRNVWADGKIPVVVGGTGLYIENLINGTTPIPPTSETVRKYVADMQEKEGLEVLYQRLKDKDPETAARLSVNDKTRLMRAMEVYEDTKISLSEWYKKPMVKRLPEAEFFIIKICPSSKQLDQRCYQRFDQMIAQGALAEIKALDAKNLSPDLPAMKALGVPELLAVVRGECSLSEGTDAAKLHTRQYAKRQRTWFRNKLKADYELGECYCQGNNCISDILNCFKGKCDENI